MGDLPPLPILTPRAPIVENDAPIQSPGADRLVKRVTVGGPGAGQDVRFVVSDRLLSMLLDVANRSTTSRAIVYGAGFKLTSWSAKGHVFQVMTILGRNPVPEVPVILAPTITEIEPEPGVFKEGSLTVPDPEWSELSNRLIGGPDGSLRLYLSTALLQAMLECAGRSSTRRAVMHRAGLVLDTYVSPAGDPYQIVTVLGSKPEPERASIVGGTP